MVKETQFKKGISGNPNGRPKGSVNKSTNKMRDFMQSFLNEKFEKLDEVFELLEPKDKINAIIKMLPYMIPKQVQMDVMATHTQIEQPDFSKLTDEDLHNYLKIVEKLNE
ncbi:DUF5681 domain-containing protein [Bizionia sp.]|uniref:DUF5681 domain-containing protein n=1 Tax=Bizionia sp. TaxID=1954480 RepID=UPI003A8FBB1D